MNVPLLDLRAQYSPIKEEINAAIAEVMESQHFILGPKVQECENAIARYSEYAPPFSPNLVASSPRRA